MSNNNKSYITFTTREEISVDSKCEVYITEEEKIELEKEGELSDEFIFNTLENQYITTDENIFSGQVEIEEQEEFELSEEEYQKELKVLMGEDKELIKQPLEEKEGFYILKFNLSFDTYYNYEGIVQSDNELDDLSGDLDYQFTNFPVNVEYLENIEYSNMQIIDKKQSQTPTR